MKIEDIKRNRDELIRRVTMECPEMLCVIVGRNIVVEGDAVILEFGPNEEMLRSIAEKNQIQFLNIVDEMTGEDVKVVLRGGEKRYGRRKGW